MGKVGRFACIFLPMALTLGAFICLLIIGLGGLNSNSSLQSSIYFFRADTSQISNGDSGFSVAGLDVGPKITASVSQKVADFYDVYMWNYCSGTGNSTVTFCSPRKTGFWFNPEQVWGLSGTLANKLFSSALRDGLSAYEKTAHWMYIAYAISFFTTLATFLIGFFAICSRWGSFVTSLIAGVSTLFTILWAGTVTGMYAVLAGVFDSGLKQYNVHASLGGKGLAITWLAAAFSIAAGLFWTISICCCSGKSARAHQKEGKSGT